MSYYLHPSSCRSFSLSIRSSPKRWPLLLRSVYSVSPPFFFYSLPFSHSPSQTPALRSIGNIVTGTDHQTQAVLDANALVHFHKLLCDSSKPTIQKEASWTISNITAGQPHQIQAIVDAGLIKPIIDIMAKVG